MNSDRFHSHLDVCRQCEQQPFNLCPSGLRLLTEAVTNDGKPLWKDAEPTAAVIARLRDAIGS